jgi:DUF971 family protein
MKLNLVIVTILKVSTGEWRKVDFKISTYSVQIDEEDFERASTFTWHKLSKKSSYFSHTLIVEDKKKHLLFHRFIINCLDSSLVVDHKDGNPFNCKKENLRICTRADNAKNRKINKSNISGYKGVSPTESKWRARIIAENGKRLSLGTFDTPEKAHEAYCRASKLYHKEFGRES